MEGKQQPQEGDVRVEQRGREPSIYASMFAPAGENYKFIDLPLSNYAS